ncbi:TetR-like C-terminal domain-containing protein [Alkalibacillus silvisoli]|uniref:TetR/AcrR family transcriptional regulator n=1 Tax=Alkalibacillus silvisoli TaxID=392823 RepID=A0ABN0ZUV0_9BACI
MKRDLRVVKTKQNLKIALLELLKEKPLEDITVTELCRNSKITRRTFYLHYNNVPHYFEEFIDHLLLELEDAITKTTQDRIENKDQLEPKMINLFEHVYENKEIYSFIFSSSSKFSYYEMFLNKIKLLVKYSMKSRNLQQEKIDFKVSFYANAILGLVLEWYYEGFQTSTDDMNQALIRELTNN